MRISTKGVQLYMGFVEDKLRKLNAIKKDERLSYQMNQVFVRKDANGGLHEKITTGGTTKENYYELVAIDQVLGLLVK
tara:strand:+ start:131 stop:364 length:234 start_codon:yes stop_codon:yes gene_type:complete